MKSSEWTSPAHSGEGEIFSRLWAHEEPKAVLLLVHGMAEHSARYADFGSFLAENGFAVFMNDHAGHGRSAVVQGHFADRDGWEHVLADLHRLEADARAKYPGLPVFIFGHSMGSFLTREYIARWGGGLSAAVVCGTMGANPLLGFARALASLQAAVKGPQSPGKLIESLSTGGYHKQFPGEGPSAWLAADKSVQEAFDADPDCGFTFTAATYRDMFGGLAAVTGPSWAARVPKSLPVFVVAGDRGICNTMAPNWCDLSGLADIPNKPPILWIRGEQDLMVSDTSACDLAFLGKAGLVPGYPGEEVCPPQPMLSQTRFVLDRYSANGGSYHEAVIPGGHGCMLDHEDEFIYELRNFF